MLQLIKSEHVIKLSEIYEWQNKLYLFLEYMDGMSLNKIIMHYHTEYSLEFKKFTIWSAAKGLFAIHELNILHRDIKSDNIFCNSEGEIKVADLGVSVCLTKDQAYRKTK